MISSGGIKKVIKTSSILKIQACSLTGNLDTLHQKRSHQKEIEGYRATGFPTVCPRYWKGISYRIIKPLKLSWLSGLRTWSAISFTLWFYKLQEYTKMKAAFNLIILILTRLQKFLLITCAIFCEDWR